MQKYKERGFGAIEIVMSIAALVLLLSLFLKAIINIDTGYDAGWYHLPFAARIWKIIPKEAFITEKSIEYRFDGFPLLAHFFQGLFWKLTRRIQTTNLVCYFSVLTYLLFLKSFLKIPLYLSALSILTIPAILTHSTTSFVDLPGNIGASITIVMLFQFFSQSQLPSRKDLLVTLVGALVGANIKPQLQPLVFVICCILGIRVAWLFLKYAEPDRRQIWITIFCSAIASMAIFATPIKNIALYSNPVYPIKVEVFGKVLNHKAVPQTYSEGNRPQKWLRSVLEINTPQWSVDQFNYSGIPENLDRAGGFFSAYMIFNLLSLFAFAIVHYKQKQFAIQKDKNKPVIALIIVFASSIFVANFPQSHELRYFMFWAIVLVTFNLSILCSIKPMFRSLHKSYLLVYLAFFIVMCAKINNYYLFPVFEPETEFYRGYTSVEDYMKVAVKTELIAKMRPNQRNCLIAAHAIPNPDAVPYASIANAIFYSSYFHPEVNYDYSIKAVTNPNSCGNFKKVP